MLFKKCASYPSIALLTLPLVAHAMEATDAQHDQATPAPHCAALAESLDDAARQQLNTFYELRDNRPAWSDKGRREALREQLAALADDGLEPTDYPVSDAEDVCADLQISLSYLQALLHLRGGRLPATRHERIWHAKDYLAPDPRLAVLSVATVQDDLAEAFARSRPALPQYQQLRSAYAIARQLPLPHWESIPSGPLLKPRGRDPRVPLLRARLAAEGYLASPTSDAGEQFDNLTVAALQVFQEQHGLKPDGLLGTASIAELNVTAQTRRDQLRANLERLRRIADDLAQARVVINVAGAELRVFDQGTEAWRTRTQVGRPGRETPLLAAAIVRLTLNPTWTVPPTILREDKLPAIREDLGYLDQHQMSVYDTSGNRLDPQQVDWADPGPIRLRQAAGTQNPLGRLALRFDNPFAVYLHDTPSQALFDKSPRFFSSGCVRVEAVDSLLPWLLPPEELTTVQDRLGNGKTQNYRLTTPAPLLIAYWTVEADADGGLRYLPDIYSRDAALIRQLDAARRTSQ